MSERPVTQMFKKVDTEPSGKGDRDGLLRSNGQSLASNNASRDLPPLKAARHAVLPINTSGATPRSMKRRLEQSSSFPSKKPKAVIPGTPWQYYEAVYITNDFFRELIYAIGKAPNFTTVHISQFDFSDGEQASHKYLQLQHDNIVNAIGVYNDSGHYFVVLEEMKTSLLQVCRCPGFLTKDQMKSIFTQVSSNLYKVCFSGL